MPTLTCSRTARQDARQTGEGNGEKNTTHLLLPHRQQTLAEVLALCFALFDSSQPLLGRDRLRRQSTFALQDLENVRPRDGCVSVADVEDLRCRRRRGPTMGELDDRAGTDIDWDPGWVLSRIDQRKPST